MKEGNIRRIIRTITILVLVSTLLLNAALCEQTAWDCPECGRTGNTGNYCGNCAHPAPWMGVVDAKGTESTQMDVSAFQKKNNIVSFGHYEQDNDLSNGPEEIEWIVLDYEEKERKALLLSKYGLDVKPYNMKNSSVTWEESTIRNWLNNEFLNKAFTKEEQSAILLTKVNNEASHGYSKWNTSGGYNTQDQVFLLSYVEANQYLWVENLKQNTMAKVAPTAYAIAHGARRNAKSETADGEAAGWWWLRSPGYYQSDAAVVSTDGSLYYYYVKFGYVVVRPALWLNLESDIF